MIGKYCFSRSRQMLSTLPPVCVLCGRVVEWCAVRVKRESSQTEIAD